MAHSIETHLNTINPKLNGLGFSVDCCNTVLIYAGRGVLWVTHSAASGRPITLAAWVV